METKNDIKYLDLIFVYNAVKERCKMVCTSVIGLMFATLLICVFVIKPSYRVEALVYLPPTDENTINACRDYVKSAQGTVEGVYKVHYSMGKRVFKIVFAADDGEKVLRLAKEHTGKVNIRLNTIVQENAIRRHELNQVNQIRREINALRKELPKGKISETVFDKRLKNLENRVATADKKLKLQKVTIHLPQVAPKEPVFPQTLKYVVQSGVWSFLIICTAIMVKSVYKVPKK